MDRPMMRFPEAVVTRPANVELVMMAPGIFSSPPGGVGGGEIGTGVMRPVAVSRRWRPPVPRITAFPSFSTAFAAGREPSIVSLPCWRVFRLIVLMVFALGYVAYMVVRSVFIE